MNEALFWNYIEKSRQESEQDTEQQITILAEELENLDKKQLFAFGSFVDYYTENLGQALLWNAAKVILAEIDEDLFDNFRYWVILQGKEMYGQILVNPDCIAEFCGTEIIEEIKVQAENLGILADTVYENNTERTDFYEKMNSWQEENFELDFEDIDSGFLADEIITDFAKLEELYPALCKKFF